MTTHYTLQILPGTGYANGINEAGQVVGAYVDGDFTVPAWWIPTPVPGALLTHPPQYALNLYSTAGSLPFTRVDNDGNAIGLQQPSVFNIASGGSFNTPLTSLADINNNGQVVGRFADGGSGVLSFLTGAHVEFGADGIGTPIGSGINNSGAVVGSSTDGMGNTTGFYFPGNVIDLPDAGLNLVDINDSGMAIGTSTALGQPVYMDFQNFNINKPPTPQAIPLAGSTYEANPSQVSAINNGNTIVGAGTGFPASYPFVYQVGQSGPPANLNDLVVNSAGYSLVDARDINDAGQIVGKAVGPDGTFGYVATPILLFRILPNLLPIIENILRSLTTEVKRAEGPALTDAQKKLLDALRKQQA
jgi:probable HAF family extracellular repeat protein